MAKNSGLIFDDSVFHKKLKVLSHQLGRNEKDFIREQTALLAREVSRFTPPFADYPRISNKQGVASAKDIKAGQGAIHDDLFKIVTTQKMPVINRAKKSFGTKPILMGRKQIAAGVITDIESLKRWHRSHTSPRMRIWRKLNSENKMWVSSVILNKYIKSLYPRVGEAKATFYKAALQLGGKATAVKAVKSNAASAQGSGVVSKGQGKVVGTIKGRAGGLFHTFKYLPRLRRDRLIKALKRGEILMKAAAKKAKFKTN